MCVTRPASFDRELQETAVGPVDSAEPIVRIVARGKLLSQLRPAPRDSPLGIEYILRAIQPCERRLLAVDRQLIACRRPVLVALTRSPSATPGRHRRR